MLKELEALVDQLKMIRQELVETVSSLSPAQLRVPFPGRDWSIKDAMAHITANEGLMTEILKAGVSGQPSPVPVDFDNDRFNAESVARAREKSEEEVLEDLQTSRERLLTLLDGLQPEQLAQCGAHPQQGELTVKEFLVVVYAHEATHVREIVEHARQLRKPIERP